MTAYWESTIPGEGRRPPRVDAPSDARVISLNGEWAFRLSPTAEGTGTVPAAPVSVAPAPPSPAPAGRGSPSPASAGPGSPSPDFARADFDDAGWDRVQVPGHWVLNEFTPLAGGPARSMRGTAEGPLYTNTAYPIPLDPPRVPHENPTADYRRVFELPDGVEQRFSQPEAILRFRGVDSCAKVWLNGEELGWSTGSRLPFEFDVRLRPGRNVLAVRVHRWSAGTYLEDQDMWWLPGIFRDVELIERPVGGIDDHFVHADYDPETGLGTLRVDCRAEGRGEVRVEVPELGVEMAAGETESVQVEPWSAEHPRLYRGWLRSQGESVPLSIGFRRVEIRDGVLIANGRPVKFRGVNRHEHHPETGRTLDRKTMIQDIVMMKRANIDAVRTSHYPPHPQFLQLCDEYGLWVVEECDLETHGFIYAGWEGNPPAAPEWADALLDRIRRMVERDKNHPSIVVWSLANESDGGEAFGILEHWIRDRDPSRPVLYERDRSYRNSDFYAVMYPSLEELERIAAREEERLEGVTDDDDARRRGLPFLLVEYAHAMGNGPGSLCDYWQIIESHNRLCGGFVWEWIDHGFFTTADDGTRYIMHGGDVDYEPNGGRYCLDGLVFADRTPSPALAQLAKAYEPFDIRVGETITVVNKRHSADTSDVEFLWTLEADGAVLDRGRLPLPVVDPGGDTRTPLPVVAAVDDAREHVLSVEAVLAKPTSWAPTGHCIGWGQGVLAPHRRAPGYTAPRRPPGRPSGRGQSREPAEAETRVGAAAFDSRTGRLKRIGPLDVDGPWLDLYRAPTENDHGQGDLNDLAFVWRATGLDRLTHDTSSVRCGDGWLHAVGRTAPAGHPHRVEWSMLWFDDGEGLGLTVEVEFVGPWADTPYRHGDIWVPRLGLLFALPGGFESAEWYGRGPGESYVDSFEGSRIGRHSLAIDDLGTDYPVPQENGNHVQTRWLALHGPGLPTLRVDGRPFFDFTARRWTSRQLERAHKPHELLDSGRVWLNIDHAQQGLGSASVGPELPERYRIPREHAQWEVRFAVE